jgi:hypothetical protein
MTRFTLTLYCTVLLTACGSRGHGELNSPGINNYEPTPGSTSASSAPSKQAKPNVPTEHATVGASCPPVSLKVRDSDPPFEVRLNLRATSDGDVVNQLNVSRAQPAVQQTLQVDGMDALSIWTSAACVMTSAVSRTSTC